MKYEYKSGGMRFGWIELMEFQNNLASDISINLNLKPILIFRNLIEEIKLNDNWDYNSYSSINHNCQHFCAKVISILKAKLIVMELILKIMIVINLEKKKILFLKLFRILWEYNFKIF